MSQFSAGRKVQEDVSIGRRGSRSGARAAGDRRRFTAAYKLKIVVAAEACTKPREIGALLRREGLYSSLLTEWRRARQRRARCS